MTRAELREYRQRAYVVMTTALSTHKQQARDVLALANEIDALNRQIENMKINNSCTYAA